MLVYLMQLWSHREVNTRWIWYPSCRYTQSDCLRRKDFLLLWFYTQGTFIFLNSSLPYVCSRGIRKERLSEQLFAECLCVSGHESHAWWLPLGQVLFSTCALPSQHYIILGNVPCCLCVWLNSVASVKHILWCHQSGSSPVTAVWCILTTSVW